MYICVCVYVCAFVHSPVFSISREHLERKRATRKKPEKTKREQSTAAASWGCKAVTVSQHTSVHPGKEIHAFDLAAFQDIRCLTKLRQTGSKRPSESKSGRCRLPEAADLRVRVSDKKLWRKWCVPVHEILIFFPSGLRSMRAGNVGCKTASFKGRV